jgi:hypothetical protein
VRLPGTRLIFGGGEAVGWIPAPLAEMVEHPGCERAWSAVYIHIENVLESDPGRAAAAAEALAGYYRQTACAVRSPLPTAMPSGDQSILLTFLTTAAERAIGPGSPRRQYSVWPNQIACDALVWTGKAS